MNSIRNLTITLFTVIVVLVMDKQAIAQDERPLRLAVAGTTHGHVTWILGKNERKDVLLAGIFERDQDLVQRHIKKYGLPGKLFYDNLENMLDNVKPEAVVAFGSIYEHMAVVEACAPRGIHVMVEKPLAISVEHAERMLSLAKKHHIILLTNYETSWYATTEKSHQLAVDSNFAGRLRKAVFHHGHEGPKEIGVSAEFFNWLTDPKLNGGGALVDFGCYGANIMTYLMGASAPVAVTAITRQFKPAIYPRVDDEATIIVDYADAQCIIQASWNWPFGRKDMEIYGETGYIIAQDKNLLRIRNKTMAGEQTRRILPEDVGVYTDPFSYFAGVIRKRITVPAFSPYDLANNVQVVRILEAARTSAAIGKKVTLK